MRYYKSYVCSCGEMQQSAGECKEVQRMLHPEEAAAERITSNKINRNELQPAAITVFLQASAY